MRTINIRFYSIHIRSEGKVIDYLNFFRRLEGSKGIEVDVSPDYTIVIDSVSVTDGNTVEIVLLGGDPTSSTVYYDSTEQSAVEEPSSRRRWIAKPTRLALSLDEDLRIMGLESTRGGVTPTLLERYLEKVAITDYPQRTVDITPMPSKSFLEAINDFERIRLASVEVSRPNWDWVDQANYLYDMADESGAQSSIAEVKAPRGESLNETKGLVGVIKDVASSKNPSIKNAKITGRKYGDTADRTVSLSYHHEKSATQVDPSKPLNEENQSVIESIIEYIHRLKGREHGERQ